MRQDTRLRAVPTLLTQPAWHVRGSSSTSQLSRSLAPKTSIYRRPSRQSQIGTTKFPDDKRPTFLFVSNDSGVRKVCSYGYGGLFIVDMANRLRPHIEGP